MSAEVSSGVEAEPDVARCSRCHIGALECTNCVFRGGAHGREVNDLKGRACAAEERALKAEMETESLRATFSEVAKALGLPGVGDAMVQAGMVRAELDRANRCAQQLVKARSGEVAKLMSALTKRNATIGNLRTAKRRADRALYEHEQWSAKRVAELESEVRKASIALAVERSETRPIAIPEGAKPPALGRERESRVYTVKPTEGPSPPDAPSHLVTPREVLGGLKARIEGYEKMDILPVVVPDVQLVAPTEVELTPAGMAHMQQIASRARLRDPAEGRARPTFVQFAVPDDVQRASQDGEAMRELDALLIQTIVGPRPRDPADRFGALGPNDEPLWGDEEPSPVEGT